MLLPLDLSEAEGVVGVRFHSFHIAGRTLWWEIGPTFTLHVFIFNVFLISSQMHHSTGCHISHGTVVLTADNYWLFDYSKYCTALCHRCGGMPYT